jgi:hypothetical protein
VLTCYGSIGRFIVTSRPLHEEGKGKKVCRRTWMALLRESYSSVEQRHDRAARKGPTYVPTHDMATILHAVYDGTSWARETSTRSMGKREKASHHAHSGIM